MTDKSHHAALPDDHALHWYRLQRVLGQGAFGITYLALDVNLDRLVAIKEYMPSQLATRAGDLSIKPLSDDHHEDFRWGLTRFVDEARTLTKFEHPNLVRVLNVFELHGSAYMVMNYEQGESLQQVLKREKTLPEKRLLQVLFPLLGGLELIHARGFVHRDIKPGNIFIRTDGSPVLLDFGSARQTRGHADPQTLTTLVSPGYAPIEQYISKSDRQGPWTDIYGLAATMYRAIAGMPPSSATDRSAMLTSGMNDDLQPLAVLGAGRYAPGFLAAIDHALAFRVEDRPQSVAAWRAEFGVDENEIDTQPDNPQSGAEVITERIMEPTTAVAPPPERRARPRQVDGEARTEPVAAATAAPDAPRNIAPAPPPARKRKWWPAALATAAAVVLLLGVAIAKRDRPAGEAPTVAASAGVDAPAPADENAPTSPATHVPAPWPGENAARIAELLSLAEADMAALRLMSPKGENAFERYQDVLALEPGNEAATLGMQSISRRYVELANGAMAQDKLDDAAVYLLRAGRITPPAESLPAAKAALADRFAAARLAQSKDAAKARRTAKVKSTRDKNAVPVEERVTPSDRVRKALGEN